MKARVAFELENDARGAMRIKAALAAMLQYFYIGIGQAIGGAIIMDGKLWLALPVAPEKLVISPLTRKALNVSAATLAVWKQSLSGPNIVRRARERLTAIPPHRFGAAMSTNFTARDMAREANNGDDFSIMMIERTGKSIGTAVASMINLLSIERLFWAARSWKPRSNSQAIIEEAATFFNPALKLPHSGRGIGADGVAIGSALLARDAGADRNSPSIQRRLSNLLFLLRRKARSFLLNAGLLLARIAIATAPRSSRRLFRLPGGHWNSSRHLHRCSRESNPLAHHFSSARPILAILYARQSRRRDAPRRRGNDYFNTP